MDIHPVTLVGKVVCLEPLSEAHIEDLAIVGNDKSIWEYMLCGEVTNKEKMLSFVKKALNRQSKETSLPFAVIHLASSKAVGCSSYLYIQKEHRSLEIGGTWYGSKYQRTGVNTECKYLLLKYAFEELNCIRVQLKTDLRNIRSQRAIERIGARKEGIFRNHLITPDGTIRDSIYYSIIDSEWSELKTKLEKIMLSYSNSYQ